MTKVKKRKLKSDELEQVKKKTEGKSEREKTLKAIGKEEGQKKKKDQDKKEASRKKVKDKEKTKKSNVSLKEVKATWKDEYPSTLTTKDLTKLIEEMSSYSLGEDYTTGAKNLRRKLRSMEQYNDGEVTHYRWSISDSDDVEEVAELVNYYSIKATKMA